VAQLGWPAGDFPKALLQGGGAEAGPGEVTGKPWPHPQTGSKGLAQPLQGPDFLVLSAEG
jgi:hypothetical protein